MAKNKKLLVRDEHILNDLTSLSKTIMPLTRQLLGHKGYMEMEIISNWKDIVGEDMAQYSLPQKLKFAKDKNDDGCLEIMVLSGAFAMEIKQREPAILEKLNIFFGYAAISRLKIVQNNCPENFLITKNPIDNVKKNLVTKEEENYITAITKEIGDEELRRRLETIGHSVFGQKRNKGD